METPKFTNIKIDEKVTTQITKRIITAFNNLIVALTDDGRIIIVKLILK